ncbi:MAG: VWA domain-containing protein [Planctomycetaceae bacterium]
MADWYYKQNGQVRGPVSRQELDFLVSTGKLTSTGEVRSGPSGEWQSPPGLRPQRSASQPRRSVASPAVAGNENLQATEADANAAVAETRRTPPDLVPAEKKEDSTRRQVIIGIILGILLLLLLAWLWWWLTTDPAGADGRGGQAVAGTAAGEAAGTSGNADNQQPSSARKNQPAADSSSGTTDDAPPEVQAGQPDSQGQNEDGDLAAGTSDAGTDATQKQAVSNADSVGSDAELMTDTTSGQDSAVAGDPLSKFTISAPGEATFFGLSATGRRFAFVVDRSGSMTGPRLDRAKEELLVCLSSLPEHIEVQIVFFDDVAEGNPDGYVRLTRRNLQRIEDWIGTIDARGGTNVKAGMDFVFASRHLPDAVFLLTDGEFEGDTPAHIRRLNNDANVRVNTIALISNLGETLLKRIAKDNRGDYRFVAN